MEKEVKQIDKNIGIKEDFLECLICYEQITEQGVIECCEHIFCFFCINRWAQEENRCPMCKKRFNSIKRKIVRPQEDETVLHRMAESDPLQDSELIEIPDVDQNFSRRQPEDIEDTINFLLFANNISPFHGLNVILQGFDTHLFPPRLFALELIPLGQHSPSESESEQDVPLESGRESPFNLESKSESLSNIEIAEENSREFPSSSEISEEKKSESLSNLEIAEENRRESPSSSETSEKSVIKFTSSLESSEGSRREFLPSLENSEQSKRESAPSKKYSESSTSSKN